MSQTAGLVWKSDFRNLRLRVAEVLVIQHCLRACRIVPHHAHLTFRFSRDILERLNVESLIGERMAELCESSGFVFYMNCQFFGRGHVGPPFPVLGTQARSYDQKLTFVEIAYCNHTSAD